MKLHNISISTFLMFTLLLSACNSGPKVIVPNSEPENAAGSSGIFTPNPATEVITGNNGSFGDDLHTVRVNEILPTDRYVYLNVTEKNKGFWIATRKLDVEKGATYFYRAGLLKTNFESKEYQRVFDTIYLVSNLVAEDHSKNAVLPGNTSTTTTVAAPKKEDIPMHTEKAAVHQGTMKISDLVKDPKKYDGHTVQISGTCVKVNPNIMDRNWIHLQDGSKNDFDLVVTSSSFVPEGTKVTFQGTVALNRDFGAGYRYDLILENGTLIR
jgi:hypothetical protein